MLRKLHLNFLKKRVEKNQCLCVCATREALEHVASQGLAASVSLGKPAVCEKLLGTLSPAFSMA